MSKLALTPGVFVELAAERLGRFTERDEDFEARFGRWRRPSFARRYPLEEMKHLVDWSWLDREILDLAPFVSVLAKEDRYIAGEVARFVYEEIEGKPATDKTLNTFRLHFLRRLDALGY
jgi:hypothetical protein